MKAAPEGTPSSSPVVLRGATHRKATTPALRNTCPGHEDEHQQSKRRLDGPFGRKNPDEYPEGTNERHHGADRDILA